jgi:phosphatidylethanolamine/phosphatidyl-N-methylethanolamine N-methyltransferase
MSELGLQHSTIGPIRHGAPLFLRRWLANPLRMGSVIPSSPILCRHLVRCGWPEQGGVVLELGAGTGVVSRAFLDAGLPPERLVTVEIDPSLSDHLRDTLPGVEVLQCDARELRHHLPSRFQGRIASVICGIPLVLLPLARQREFIQAMFSVAPGRGFLHFSYCVTSPLPTRKHGLTAKREAWTPLNLPPASVWRYTPVMRPPAGWQHTA